MTLKRLNQNSILYRILKLDEEEGNIVVLISLAVKPGFQLNVNGDGGPAMATNVNESDVLCGCNAWQRSAARVVQRSMCSLLEGAMQCTTGNCME